MKALLPFLPTLALADSVFSLQPMTEKLLSAAVTEASGLAVSPADGDFLWVVNDSGGTNQIHLFKTDGTAHGAVTIEGARNRDWEDMASFVENGKPYLLIADTGDNSAKRASLTLYIVREPSLPSVGKSVSGSIPVSRKIEFEFSGGPRDCESVAVDEKAGKIILVSKRDKIPQVHELPLHPKGKNNIITEPVGTVRVISPRLSFLPYRNQPTGLDISADGKSAAIVTYYGVFVFPREAGESWTETFDRQPVKAGTHGLKQAESVAFSRDGKTIYSVSEGADSPIARFTSGG